MTYRAKTSSAALALLAAAAGLWSAAAAVQAGDPPAPNKGQTATSSKPVKPKSNDRLICRDEEEIGSRLGGKRVCHTQAQWNQINASQSVFDMDAAGTAAAPQMPGGPK